MSPLRINSGPMAVLSDIQACVFDAYGTLFDVHAAVAPHRHRLGDRADAFSALWRRKHVRYTWLRSLMQHHADFWQVTQDALGHALDTFGIDDDTLRRDLLNAYRHLDAYPDAAPTLRTLRAHGLTTAILSNGSPGMLADAVAHSGLGDLLDAVLSAEAVGVFKPDPRVYRLAVDRLGVPPERIAFQTANAWDAAGAAAFGLRVVWVNRFEQIPERLPGTPNAEISSLADLPALLDLSST
jgi:2-haloacid dehalogenase